MALSAQPAIEPSLLLRRYFDSMLREYGPQRWWPARTRLEVILGAILTQNTSWENAARAIKELRRSGLLSLARLRHAARADLQALIRSAGFFRQKAVTICRFVDWLDKECNGSLAKMFSLPEEELRGQLLRIKGLGPETVDAILLYAGALPTFVADAYTRRILGRHGLVRGGAGYEETRQFLHSHLPADARLFNEYHALLVETGKRHCRRAQPNCEGCPLEPFLPELGPKPDAASKDSNADDIAGAQSMPEVGPRGGVRIAVNST
ncbi:MAG TPA: endonuclease III domain-containing protein [Terriglobia bacterium]|nr:endonuclease III domain-containing protein [Terriglobia bacterium]